MNEKYMFPDSVWIEENGIVTKWTYRDETGKIRSNESFRPINLKETAVRDSIVAVEKSIVKFNSHGNYAKALEAVKNQSPFIDLYYTYSMQLGLVGSSILFPQVRDNNLDINGPVERRVLVLEMVY